MRGYDIAIIGNGILGYSTAYALHQKDPQLKIAIIGPHDQHQSSTLAAGAMLGCFGEVTTATFASTYAQSKLEMAFTAAQLWPSWLDAINNSLSNDTKPIRTNRGTLVLLNTASSARDDENFKAIIKAASAYEAAHEEVDPLLIPGLNPNPNCRPLRALFLPDENTINPREILGGLHQILERKHTISFFNTIAKQIITEHTKVNGIILEDGNTINADNIILAAGAFSQDLIDKIDHLNTRIPRLLSGSGSGLVIKCENHDFKTAVRSPNRAGSCGVHIIPQTANTLYMGASNSLEITPKFSPKLRDCYYLIQRAIDQFNQNFHKCEAYQWQVGNRPVTVDTFPLIGATSISGLWMLTGTYRDGLHTSPLLAQLVADEILGEKPSFKHPFGPERAPLQTMSKEEAIEEFIAQDISIGYEHSIAIPKIGWHSMQEEISRKRAKEIYQQLNCQIGLPTDLLIMLSLNPDRIPFFREYYQTVTLNLTAPNRASTNPKRQVEDTFE